MKDPKGHVVAQITVKKDYLTKTGYRLPTEAEWEFACRAGTTTRFHCGEDDAVLGDYAWYYGNSKGQMHPVAERMPNDFGLFDMHGNVWQWCECPWHDYPQGQAIVDDDRTPEILITNGMWAALRGGSWRVTPEHIRAAFRDRENVNNYTAEIGFRPARTIKSQAE